MPTNPWLSTAHTDSVYWIISTVFKKMRRTHLLHADVHVRAGFSPFRHTEGCDTFGEKKDRARTWWFFLFGS